MNKLLIVFILCTVLHFGDSVPISCLAHFRYSITFEDADNPDPGLPGHSEFKYFFDSPTNKTIRFQLYNIQDTQVDNTEMVRLNDSGVVPSVLVANRSWSIILKPEPLENLGAPFGLGWQITLNREQLMTRTAWLPKESFGVKVEIKRSDVDKVTGCLVLVDTMAEPILQWKLGTEVTSFSQSAADVGSKVFLRTSTCTNDVAIVGFQTVNPTAVLYLGVTRAGFATGTITWYSLPADTICGTSCTQLQLFDMQLINNYVLLATDVALYRSNKLTASRPGTAGQILTWSEVRLPPAGESFTSGLIGYTAECAWRHHDTVRDDFVTFSYKSNGAGGTVTTTLYGWEPFEADMWENPLTWNNNWLRTQISDPAGEVYVEILAGLYHAHTHNLALLARMDTNAPLAPTEPAEDRPSFSAGDMGQTTTHLISLPLDEESNKTKTKLNFPIYTFSKFKFNDETYPTGISYIPGYYIMFAYGSRNIYASENGGGSWSLMYKADTDDIVIQVISCKAQGIFTLLTYDEVTPAAQEPEKYVIYMGRAGIPRLNPMQPLNTFDITQLNWLYIDSFGQLSVMVQQQTDGTLVKKPINITKETNEISEVNFPTNLWHGMAVAFMGGNELVALEHRDYRSKGAEDRVSYFQRPRHLNRIFSGNSGGEMILKSISYDNLPHPDYFARLRFHVLKPLPLGNEDTYGQLEFPLQVDPGITDAHDGVIGEVPNPPGDPSIDVTLTLVGANGIQLPQSWPATMMGMTIITQDATYFITTRNSAAAGASNAIAYGKRLARVGPGLQRQVVYPSGQWNVIPITGNDETFNAYIIREGPCRNSLSIEGINNDIYVLDITEGFQFKATAFSIGIPIVEKDSNIVASLTNPYLLRTGPKLQTFGYPPRQQLTFQTKSVLHKKGFTAIRVRSTRASLLCDSAVKLIEVYAGCPCNRYLKFNYPYIYSPQELLSGNPKDRVGQPIFFSLEANYRPPSNKGVMIPTCDNMYNVDPEKPRPRNKYKISQETGTLKQCSGAATRSDCGCTDADKLEDDPGFSDCKQRVYRLIYPGKLRLNLTIKTLGREDLYVGANLAVKVTEVNNRRPKFQTEDFGKLLPLLEKDKRFPTTNYFNPADLEIVMNASGLFHYKAELIPGLSFCPMTDYFMVYVDEAPLPYPMNHIIFFSTTFVIGFILFAVFLVHLAFTDPAPKRSTGPQCPPLSEMINLQDKYKPPDYPSTFSQIFGRISRLSRAFSRGDGDAQKGQKDETTSEGDQQQQRGVGATYSSESSSLSSA